MDKRAEDIKSVLKKYGQEHLLIHYETLDEIHKEQLLYQLEKINFELINNLYINIKKETKNNDDKITPIDYLDKSKLYDDYKYYENIGEKAIEEGKLSVVTMAGGQGTRLRI